MSLLLAMFFFIHLWYLSLEDTNKVLISRVDLKGKKSLLHLK